MLKLCMHAHVHLQLNAVLLNFYMVERSNNRVWFLVLGTPRHGRAVKKPGVVLGQSSQSNVNLDIFASHCWHARKNSQGHNPSNPR